MLIIVSIINNSFVIDAYGAENEPADTLNIDFSKHKNLTLSVSADRDDFFICTQTPKKSRCYRIVNDAFTPVSDMPDNPEVVAAIDNRALAVYTQASDIYNTLNSFKAEHINRLPSTSLSANDRQELLTLIKCCADIENYTAGSDDIDTLMRNVLYTHRNFMLLSSYEPESGEGHNGLSLCNEKFISDAVYKAFRREAKRPAVNMLTELGYCANNGYYYYSGGYSKYFATDVRDILKAFYQTDGSLYIIFSDIYTESGKEPLTEYSTATALHDNNGWYLTAIHMNGDLSDIADPETKADNIIFLDILSVLWKYLPFIIAFFATGTIISVIYFYLIKR